MIKKILILAAILVVISLVYYNSDWFSQRQLQSSQIKEEKIQEKTLFLSSLIEGNQGHPGCLGFDLNTNKSIEITEVGAFESNEVGPFSINVAIYDNRTKEFVAGTQVYEINRNNSKLEKKYRFKKITPIRLPIGSYRIVAQGYSIDQQNGNTYHGGIGPAINGDDSISVGSSFWNNGGISYPTTADRNIYHAANIKYIEDEIKNPDEKNKAIEKSDASPVIGRETIPITSKTQKPDREVKAIDPSKNQMFVGEWRMSSWGGHYELFENGRVTISNDGTKPSGGHWFLAYDRLYLVWKDSPDVDIFKLNTNENMTLQRIDKASSANVTFEKLQAMNPPSIKETENKPTMRRIIRVPLKSGEPVKEVEPKEAEEMYQGHSYKFIPKKESWNKAKVIAKEMGGYLASVTSDEENKFVVSLIKKASAERQDKNPEVWIGLNNDNEEKQWKWESGEKYDYTSWWDGEPNNWSNSESSVVINKQSMISPDSVGKWNDKPSDFKTYFIVERNSP